MIQQRKNGQINIVLHDKQFKADKEFPQDYFLNEPFHHIDRKFSQFIGLKHFKKTIKEIYAIKVINEKRLQQGLTCEKQVLHMLFKGNPGTGKTTVARKLAELYFEMNLLSKGHFIEAERADLVGEYIGQTAQKTRALIQKSLGGILFIDEAYSLARGGEKDFGKEAIDTLVTHMENKQHEFVLILAGYPYEMENFLQLNPGLASRFPFQLNFKDFTINQLFEIAKHMVSDREYELTGEAEWKLRSILLKEGQKFHDHFSNARFVRNLIEQSIRNQSIRLLCEEKFSTADLIKITSTDIQLPHSNTLDK